MPKTYFQGRNQTTKKIVFHENNFVRKLFYFDKQSLISYVLLSRWLTSNQSSQLSLDQGSIRDILGA